jgi:hypothetical protein
LLRDELVGYGARARLTHPTEELSRTKKPGAVSRPGTVREFQFPEYSDSLTRVNGFLIIGIGA